MIGYRTQPEPFASTIDIITAAQLIEKAIHDPTGEQTATDLLGAAEQLQHAKDYFADAASINKLYNIVYTRLGNQTDNLIKELNAMANAVRQLSGEQLKTYQSGTIYQFQGQMRLLYVRTQKLMGL